jgi:hypothetical protein
MRKSAVARRLFGATAGPVHLATERATGQRAPRRAADNFLVCSVGPLLLQDQLGDVVVVTAEMVPAPQRQHARVR